MKYGFTIIEVMIVVVIIGILASVIVVPSFLTFECHGYANSLGIPSKDAKALCDEYSSDSNMKDIIAKVADDRLSVKDALLAHGDDYTPRNIPIEKSASNENKDSIQIQILNSKIDLLEKQLDECMNNNSQTDEDNRTWKN